MVKPNDNFLTESLSFDHRSNDGGRYPIITENIGSGVEVIYRVRPLGGYPQSGLVSIYNPLLKARLIDRGRGLLGQRVTISVEVYSSVRLTQPKLMFSAWTSVPYRALINELEPMNGIFLPAIPANEWVRITFTGTFVSDDFDYDRMFFSINPNQTFTDLDNDYIDFRKMKIELGEEATPWCPSSGDGPILKSQYYDFLRENGDLKLVSKAEHTLQAVADPPTIGGIVIRYKASENGDTPPQGLWEVELPEVPPGMYLWTYTNVLYSDGTQLPSYSVSRVGTSSVLVQMTNENAIVRTDALGTPFSYADTGTSIFVTEGTQRLNPIENGQLNNGEYKVTPLFTVQDFVLGNRTVDTSKDEVRYEDISGMNVDTIKLPFQIDIVARDGSKFTAFKTQTISKVRDGFGSKVYIRYAPTDNTSLRDMTLSAGVDTRYIGTVASAELFAPENKDAYIWQPFRYAGIAQQNSVPDYPYIGMLWATGSNPPAPYLANTHYRCTAIENNQAVWELYALNVVNLVGQTVFAENGVFKGFQSENWNEVEKTGTRWDLTTGELISHGVSVSDTLRYDTGKLSISNEDKKTKIEISADGFSIIQDGQVVMQAQGQEAIIPIIRTEKSLQIGDHKISAFTDLLTDNTYTEIQWLGGMT